MHVMTYYQIKVGLIFFKIDFSQNLFEYWFMKHMPFMKFIQDHNRRICLFIYLFFLFYFINFFFFFCCFGSDQMPKMPITILYTVKPQGLKHLWGHGNLF